MFVFRTLLPAVVFFGSFISEKNAIVIHDQAGIRIRSCMALNTTVSDAGTAEE